VNADEYRIWVDGVELYIPPVTSKNVNIDFRDCVVRRHLMMLTTAPFDLLNPSPQAPDFSQGIGPPVFPVQGVFAMPGA